METGLLHLHNLLRWAVLITLLFALVNSVRGWMSKNDFTAGNRKVLLYALISCHVQLVLGWVLYFLKGYHKLLGQSDVMKNAGLRFWAVEHPVTITIAIVLVTLGYSRAKRRAGQWTAHRTAAVLMGVGLILILASIPWPWREAVGRGLFPGMS